MATAQLLDDALDAGGDLHSLLEPAAVELLTSDERDRLGRVIERPQRLDAGAVRVLADVLAAQRRLDDSLGPRALIPSTTAQLNLISSLVRRSSGPHRPDLAEVAAEWVQFAGWLRAEIRDDQAALRFLTDAEQAADEIGHGVLAAQASNFRGYVARQQQNWRGVVRWFLAEHHTPGASVHQRIGAAAQAAQGCGQLGDRDGARRLLDTAESLLENSEQEPAPRTAYWLSPTFHRLNLGLAHLALCSYGAAEDHLAAGIDGLPEDQRQAAWTVEYRDAFQEAQARR